MVERNGVWPKHCITALKKQVLPILVNPRKRCRLSTVLDEVVDEAGVVVMMGDILPLL